MFADTVGLMALGIWVYLVFGRGGYWKITGPQWMPGLPATPHPRIAIIVPARNEADVVGPAIRSLVEQDYPGRFHVFVVDDGSSDETARVAREAAEHAGRADWLTVTQASPLPRGWTGKLWALSEGVRAAAAFGADYFLFSDADIVHPQNEASRLMGQAQSGHFDLVSLMVRLSCQTSAERMLIPAFVFFFFMLYPPAWVANPARRTAAAAGGCILIREGVLTRAGGLSSICGEVIDDCALARAVKRQGPIWLGVAEDTQSLRAYGDWAQIKQMISRTAFTQLRHSTALLAGTTAGMAITYLAPPLLLFAKPVAAGLGAGAWFLMTYAFWPTLRYYRLSPFRAPLLPLIAAFYVGATIHSAIQYWRGRGGLWKGRVQDPIC